MFIASLNTMLKFCSKCIYRIFFLFVFFLFNSVSPYAFAENNVIRWHLDVIENGQIIQSFDKTSVIGQTVILTKDSPSKHCVQNICLNLSHIIISPILIAANQVHFDIHLKQNIQSKADLKASSSHTISAYHPNFIVSIGEQAQWNIIDNNLKLSLVLRILSAS